MTTEHPAATEASPSRSPKRATLAALGIDALGSGLYLPLSLLYFTQVARLPLGDVGYALSAATAGTLAVPLIAGSLADRIGARRVVVAAQLLQGLGFFGYLFVHDLVELVLTALLVGVGERSFWTTVYTFVAQSADEGELDSWYARVAVIRSIGVGAGALLAGVVLGIGSRPLYQVAIIGNAASFVAAAALLAFLVHEKRLAGGRKRVAKGGYRAVIRDRPFLAFTATNLVYSLCLTMITVALSVYVVRGLAGPGWLVGVLFALNTGLIILFQARVTTAVSVHRRTRVLAMAGLIWVIWALATAGATQLPHAGLIPYLVIGMMLFTLAEMMQSPTSTALAAAAGVDELRGRYLAIYQYGYQGAKIIAPIMFTQLFTAGRALPWLVLAILTALVIPVLLKLESHLPESAIRSRPAVAEGS